MVADAAVQGCDIILLPECLDLAWTHPSCLTDAMPLPGPRSDQMAEFARQHGIYICCGLTERDQDKVYNAAILIDDLGNILTKYRKINVLEVAADMYSVGQSISVVDTKFGKIGINICSDNYADALDIGYVLARMGAQIILSPSSWTVEYSVIDGTDPYGDKWQKPYQTLADLFNLVIVSATSVGTIVGGPYEGMKMVGCSLAVGPNQVLAKSDYNEVSGALTVISIEVPTPSRKGTQIGRYLAEQNALAGRK